MARCEDCIRQECCVRFAGARTLLCGDKADERCNLFKSTADVSPKSAWISVDERLPDNGNAVLVSRYNKSLKFSVANIDNYQGYGRWWDKDYDSKVWTITHWMPLPEPPITNKPTQE